MENQDLIPEQTALFDVTGLDDVLKILKPILSVLAGWNELVTGTDIGIKDYRIRYNNDTKLLIEETFKNKAWSILQIYQNVNTVSDAVLKSSDLVGLRRK